MTDEEAMMVGVDTEPPKPIWDAEEYDGDRAEFDADLARWQAAHTAWREEETAREKAEQAQTAKTLKEHLRGDLTKVSVLSSIVYLLRDAARSFAESFVNRSRDFTAQVFEQRGPEYLAWLKTFAAARIEDAKKIMAEAENIEERAARVKRGEPEFPQKQSQQARGREM